MKTIFRITPALVVAVAAMFVNTATHAGQAVYKIEQHADEVFNHMVELDRKLVQVYPRARNFGRIMSLSSQIKSKAIQIREAARYDRPCDWEREIARLDDLLCRFDRNVRAANERAAIGVDPPLCACNSGILSCIDEMMHAVRCMYDAIPRTCRVIDRRSRIVPAHEVPAYEFAPSYEPSSFYKRDNRLHTLDNYRIGSSRSGFSSSYDGTTIRIGDFSLNFRR